MSRLQIALDQIKFARMYTLRLLAQTKEADWYRVPASGVTHIAWQVGHMAIAEYWLALVRTRGIRPEDASLIPADFSKVFERHSIPNADPANYPNPAAIRTVFERVHEQTLLEVPTFADAMLDQPVEKPHDLVKTKHGALMWCGQHELVHAGQIGLLRRQLGYEPVW